METIRRRRRCKPPMAGSPSMDDMFEKYSTVQFEDDGAASEPSDEDSVERVRRMAEDVAAGADDASETGAAGRRRED